MGKRRKKIVKKEKVYRLRQVSVENDNSCVEDKEEGLHLVRLPVLHVTGGNPHKQ